MNTHTTPPLRDYQLAAVAAIEAACQRGVRRQLLALPTGTGKTCTFVEVIRRRGGRALVLAHRDELIRQTVAAVERWAGDLTVGVVQGERDDLDAAVVVASVQTLARPARLARLDGPFRTVVVDEAHHAAAATYRRILDAVTTADTLVLGATATPYRGDRSPLAELFDEVVYERDILSMIRAGYLCDLRGVRVQLAANFDALHTVAGDFKPGELESVLRAADAPTRIVEAYSAHAAGRRALAFTPTVAFAHELARAFTTRGVRAEALDGDTRLEERRAMLRRFRDGETAVLANCAVLTEGFDEPRADCIIVARPTMSRTLYVQMIGRGTRKCAGKTDCLVLDVAGASRRHELMTTGALYGLRPDGSETILEAQARHRAEADAAKLADEERRRLVAANIDLLRQRRLRWLADPAGELFVLALGEQGSLDVVPSGRSDGWNVLHAVATHERRLAHDVDLEMAKGVAEDFARRQRAERLLDPDAAWLDRPASERQLDALARQKLAVPAGITKGAATSLLGLHFARKRQARRRRPAWVRHAIARRERRASAAV
ncbi:MAG: DEAD/DEAH box helicase [Phycisphaerae bacterium]|nr:DEAD/DEAH box helicase [Phycisphaerae bacterium]